MSTKLILVIDDDPAARDLLTNYLVKEGFRVKIAATAEEGLRLAKLERPDVITLDVLMPERCLDGWVALTSLKADPELAETPVVMVTIIDDKNKGFALGAADYLAKPIDRDRLIAIVNKYRLDFAPPSPESLLSSNSAVTERQGAGSILVAEDDPAIREMLRYLLEQEGFEVVEAGTGRAALDQVVATPPALILLDLMMPEMDGFEFIATLRQNPALGNLPVVVVTAMDLTTEDCLRLNGCIEQVIHKAAVETSQANFLQEVLNQVHTAIYHRQASL